MPIHHQAIPDTEYKKLHYLARCKMLRKSNLKLITEVHRVHQTIQHEITQTDREGYHLLSRNF